MGLFVAVTRIELGIAYAVWSALGTTIVTVVGMLYFDEACDWTKVLWLACIVVGVVGLSLGEPNE